MTHNWSRGVIEEGIFSCLRVMFMCRILAISVFTPYLHAENRFGVFGLPLQPEQNQGLSGLRGNDSAYNSLIQEMAVAESYENRLNIFVNERASIELQQNLTNLVLNDINRPRQRPEDTIEYPSGK